MADNRRKQGKISKTSLRGGGPNKFVPKPNTHKNPGPTTNLRGIEPNTNR